MAAYRRKRDIAFETLSKKFEVVRPEGAFYIFPKAPAGMTASEFVARAIENNVLIIPGNVFSEQRHALPHQLRDDGREAGAGVRDSELSK